MFKTLPKAIAAVYWRHPANNNVQPNGWTFLLAFADDTLARAAAAADLHVGTLNKQLEFRILCGEFSHQVAPPPPPKLELIKIDRD